MILLPTTYLGNIEYFSAIASGNDIVIDIYESYPKQTYRNRCMVMSANGVMPIVAPVKHKGKVPTVDIQIDNSMPWQRNAWRTITSAYRNSPYFEHYESLIEPLFSEKYDYLCEMNDKAMKIVLEILKMNPTLSYSKDYIRKEDVGCDTTDLRDTFTPKKGGSGYVGNEYYQVFGDRIPFAHNLSIIDLLLCEGNNAINLLK